MKIFAEVEGLSEAQIHEMIVEHDQLVDMGLTCGAFEKDADKVHRRILSSVLAKRRSEDG